MLGRNISHYKSQLKSAAKSGPQFVTITEAKLFFDSNGKLIKKGQNEGLVITYKNGDIEHQELYWYNTGKLFKLDEIIKPDNNNPHINPYLGKKLWIVIRHNILIDDKQNEVKRESEIVHYSVDEQMPNFPTMFEEYDIAAV